MRLSRPRAMPAQPFWKESTQPAHAKVVSSEEQLIDLAQAPGDLSPRQEAFKFRQAADAAQAGRLGQLAKRQWPRRSIRRSQQRRSPPPPAASEFPRCPNHTRCPAAAGRDDAHRDAALLTATASGGGGASERCRKPPAKAASETAGIAQASTSTSILPAKLSGKSSARVVVARIDTTAPNAAMETSSQQVPLGAPAKSEKAAKIALKSPAGYGRAAGRLAGARRVHPAAR